MVQPLQQLVKKLNTVLPCDPTSLFLGYILKWTESQDWNRYLYTDVHSCTIHSSQAVKTAQVLNCSRTDKQNVACPHDEMLLSHKKECHSDTLKALCYVKTLCRQKRTNIVWFHLHKVPRIGKFRVTERTEAAPGWLPLSVGSYCLPFSDREELLSGLV